MTDENRGGNHIDLTSGPIMGHVLRMTPPMVTAFFAMMAFNLADTWFVSRLGVEHLAAMGFTFPVVLLFHSIAMGIGLGTSSCVSRAIGARDHDRVQHLATYSLGLAVGLMGLLSVAGLLALPVLLPALGAAGRPLRLATHYLSTWFLFGPIMAVPMVGNNAIYLFGHLSIEGTQTRLNMSDRNMKLRCRQRTGKC
jgi:Na+-driven multidrug efflux pump